MSLRKRGIAWLLCVAMTISLLPVSALAEEADTGGEPVQETVEAGTAYIMEGPELAEAAAQKAAEREQDVADSKTAGEDTANALLTSVRERTEEDPISLNSAVDSSFEIGYRFSEEESWNIVSAVERSGENDYSGYAVFDENQNYAIRLEEGTSFPVSLFLILMDADGNSQEIKGADGGNLTFTADTRKLSIPGRDGYTLSVYADWLDSVYFHTPNTSELGITSNAEWAQAHPKTYQYVEKGGTYPITLARDKDAPYANPFRDEGFHVTFSANDAAPVFADAKDAVVSGNYGAVSFLKSGASIKAGDFFFQVEDPLSGEVTYTLNGRNITLGQDAAWAKNHSEYVCQEGGTYTIPLADSDTLPLSVRFSLRGISDPKELFTDAKDAVVSENDPYTILFQKQDASVKVGAYTFQIHDNRGDEIRYHVNGISTTVGQDAEQAKQNARYVLAEEDTVPITLDETVTFPAEVRFSIPRNTAAKPEFAEMKDAVLKEGSEDTILFAKQDASVKVGRYTFKAHSPYVGAVRYVISSSGRQVTVGTDAAFAEEAQKAAAEQTKQRRQQDPSAAAVPPEYVCFADGAHTIELLNGEYFPCSIRFSSWDTEKGWSDEETRSFTGVEASGEPAVEMVQDHPFSIHAAWLEEIRYQIPGGETITVGYDADRAKAGTRYELFDADGNYAINPNNSILFPCTVKFMVRGASGRTLTTEETFQNTGSSVEVRGHTFTMRDNWRSEIICTTDGHSVIVGHDAAWAKTHAGYETAGEDNTYAIQVDANVTFPVEVTFQRRGDPASSAQKLTFANLKATHKVGGITFSIHPKWLDEVSYTINRTVENADGSKALETRTVTVGKDEERAQQAIEAAQAATEAARKQDPNAREVLPDYVLSEDNKYTIELDDDAFFPYGIAFNYTRLEKAGERLVPGADTRRVWFEAPDAEQPVGDYTFTVTSKRTDPAKLVRAGVWIGVTENEEGERTSGHYIPMVRTADAGNYWSDKAAEEEYDASLQSLLPLREEELTLRVSGFFDWELKNARLDLVFPEVEGAKPAKDQTAWGLAGTYGTVGPGDYTILDNGSKVELTSNRFEMITGQLDQLRMDDMRYIVRVSVTAPQFGNDQIRMKAAYADETRSSIRIKGNMYTTDAGKYTAKGEQKASTIGAYTFTVNESWKNGPVYLSMWMNDQFDFSDNPWMDEENQENREFFKKLTPMVCEGVYRTVEEYRAGETRAVDITDRIWNQELDTQNEENRYTANLVSDTDTGTPYFTIVWYRDGIPVAVQPIQVKVHKDPDAQWELPEEVLPDLIRFRSLHTHNTTVKNKDGGYDNWELVRDSLEHDETADIDIQYYRMPKNVDYGSMAADRFYLSATYRHFTKEEQEDALGNKVKADTYEPVSEDDYYGQYDTPSQTQSEVNQKSGTAVWQKYGIRVFAGSRTYKTLAEAQRDSSARDVTAQIFTRVGYGAEFTDGVIFSAFNAAGELFDALGIRVKSSAPVVKFTRMTLDQKNHVSISEASAKIYENGTLAYPMPDSTWPARGMYSLLLEYWRDEKAYNWAKIQQEGVRVLVSDRDLGEVSYEEALPNGKDVTGVAFQETGFTANFSFGVHFHIYDRTGKLIQHQLVMTEEYRPGAKSADTWFRIQGGYQKQNDATTRYAGFAMPYTADSYYVNGYQTVFLMNQEVNSETGDTVYTPVEEDSNIYPTFWTGDATIYGLEENQEYDEIGKPVTATSVQKDGENRKTFHNKGAIRYSAAAQNGLTLRNYWVTFLTQSTNGPELFVNTTNDETHFMKDNAGRQLYGHLSGGKVVTDTRKSSGVPIANREVFISDADGSHDIFFANVGNERLEDLEVTLTDSSVIRLDEYWDLDEVRSLNAYTTLDRQDQDGVNIGYGGIPNIAKIRIYAVNPSQAKSIDTYLVISGKNCDPAIIHLTGTVGDVQITNYPEDGELPPAVKWVPYAQLIQTNNIYGGETVAFALSGAVPAGKVNGQNGEYYGRLPDGMELRPNGEIYGAPMETGTFHFTVTANFSYHGTASSDSREYSLTVLINSDENVWSENDWEKDGDQEKFGIKHWIPDIVINNSKAEYDDAAEPYKSPESMTETERRERDTSSGKVEPVTWTKYQDVVFSIQNYNEKDHPVNGEADFEWFIDLWLNGIRLYGIRLEEDQEFTPEMREVYDFYYRNGCFEGVITGETIAVNAFTDGKTDSTIAGEFRVGADTSNTQKTGAQNMNVKGPKGIKKQLDNPDKPKPSGGGGGGGGGGGSAERFAVTLTAVSHGRLNCTHRTAMEGSSVKVTATPEAGYEVESVTVKTTGGKEITTSQNGNVYTFEMPANDVKVSAVFSQPIYRIVSEIEDPNGTVTPSPDKAARGTLITLTANPTPGYEAVNLYAWDGNGIKVELKDLGDGKWTFTMPDSGVRFSGKFQKILPFNDVPDTFWAFNDIVWAYRQGLMVGVTPVDYQPQGLINSTQSVLTLARMSGVNLDIYEDAVNNDDLGLDLPEGASYRTAAFWAREYAIIPDGPFAGRNPISRGEYAVILMKYLKNVEGLTLTVAPEEVVSFPDAAMMTQEENNAFQILRKAGVFLGDSQGRMNPRGNSTRAHLAALLHRLSDYLDRLKQAAAEQETAT